MFFLFLLLLVFLFLFIFFQNGHKEQTHPIRSTRRLVEKRNVFWLEPSRYWTPNQKQPLQVDALEFGETLRDVCVLTGVGKHVESLRDMKDMQTCTTEIGHEGHATSSNQLIHQTGKVSNPKIHH